MADEEKYKVILIGDAGTGKTHLLNRFMKGTVLKASQPTIGVEFSTSNMTLKNGAVVKVNLIILMKILLFFINFSFLL